MADIAQLSIKVDASGIGTADDAMKRMSSTADMLTGVVNKLAAAWASWKLIQVAKDATLAAARYETLGIVMNVVGNNAGYTAKQMEAFQAGLQKTGISMVESRNSLNMMAAAQMDLAGASDLARGAQHAATIAGISSSEAFGSMVKAISSGEVEILKTMGILVSWEAGYKRLAPTIGKVSGNLTEHEKLLLRQKIVLEEVAKRAGVYEAAMGTVGKQLTSIPRYLDDLRISLGNIFLPMFADAIWATVEALKGMKKWFDENKEATDQMGRSLKAAGLEAGGLAKDLWSVISGATEISDEFTIMEVAAQGLAIVVAGIRDIFNVIWGTVEMIVGGLNTAVSGLLYGLAKLAQFEPPSWLKAWFEGSVKTSEAGTARQRSGLSSEAGGRVYQGAEPAMMASHADKIAPKGPPPKPPVDDKLLKTQETYVKGLEKEAATLGMTKSEQDMYTLSLQKLTDAQFNAAVLAISTVAAYEEEQEAMKKGQATYEAEREELQFIANYNKELVEGRKSGADAIRDSIDPMRAYVKELEAIAALEGQKGGLTAAEAGLARTKVWKRQEDEMIKLRIESSETNQTIAGAWDITTRGMEDAFVRFATTGKASFKEMTSSILADLARMMANRAFAQLLDFGINAYFGGVKSTPMGDTTVPMGGGGTGLGAGDVSGPGVVIGMANPGGSTANVTTNITINTSEGEAKSTSSGQGDKAKELGRMIETAVQRVIAKELRPAGLLNPVGA